MKKPRKIEKTPYHSLRIGKLPLGCRQCVQGKKTVLFITGLCPRHCDYCPISDSKYGKDVVYANEWPTKRFDELCKEIELCGSEGAGITGGDPLARLDRTTRYISGLKKKFGQKFHIHLYTSLDLINRKNLLSLRRSGLDEIRFHPDLDSERFWHRIKLAGEFDWSIGVEIPAIPGKEPETKRLIDALGEHIHFLNINELELADTNASRLSELGYMSKDGVSYGVKGAERLAKRILTYCKTKRFDVHYCTARLKDRIQLTRRIKRRAKNTAKEYDTITKEGTLIRGAVYTKELFPSAGYTKRLETIRPAEKRSLLDRLTKLRRWLVKTHKIPEELIGLDKERLRILTTGAVIEELTEHMKTEGFQPAIIEEYPTWDRLIVDLELL